MSSRRNETRQGKQLEEGARTNLTVHKLVSTSETIRSGCFQRKRESENNVASYFNRRLKGKRRDDRQAPMRALAQPVPVQAPLYYPRPVVPTMAPIGLPYAPYSSYLVPTTLYPQYPLQHPPKILQYQPHPLYVRQSVQQPPK
ncbi:unnamed protein product [Vicia faba]|uniref:Uncharacterized protein n=1 Tax=Vicia faba TaxID=3906 RepID=A0AAV0ZR31_VICFA|nr:unnamed protein product [Vicia faba]CAI8599461.1 unnamed protein product [Vicia faba]